MRAGWALADSRWVLAIDSDGQTDLTDFASIWDAREQADLVLGVRVERGDPLHRTVVTAATRLLASTIARRRLGDPNAPFKLIRRDLFEHVAPLVPADAFAPTVLLVVAATRCGARVVELPVRQLPRLSGRSSLHPRRLATAVVRSSVETLRNGRRPTAPYAPTVRPAATATVDGEVERG